MAPSILTGWRGVVGGVIAPTYDCLAHITQAHTHTRYFAREAPSLYYIIVSGSILILKR